MTQMLNKFFASEDAAVTVDWVVLSAGAVAMAIAATDVLSDGIGELTSNLENQLRQQQISDAFVQFTSDFFDPLYDAGMLSEADAEVLFEDANLMTNNEILVALEGYIEKMVNGDISEAELEEAFAVASVAAQRNIVDDEVVEYYFTPEGGADYTSTT